MAKNVQIALVNASNKVVCVGASPFNVMQEIMMWQVLEVLKEDTF